MPRYLVDGLVKVRDEPWTPPRREGGEGMGRGLRAGFGSFMGQLLGSMLGSRMGGGMQQGQQGNPMAAMMGAMGGIGQVPPSMRPAQMGGGYGYRPPPGGGMLPGQMGISPYSRPISPQMFSGMYGNTATGGSGGYSPWTNTGAQGMQRFSLGIGGRVRPPMPRPVRQYPVYPARQALGTGNYPHMY